MHSERQALRAIAAPNIDNQRALGGLIPGVPFKDGIQSSCSLPDTIHGSPKIERVVTYRLDPQSSSKIYLQSFMPAGA